MLQQNSAQFKRQRKALFFFPLVVIPMLCFAFYGLGGGKGEAPEQEMPTDKKGFNTRLPGAHFANNEQAKDKMGFYEKADADSAKLQLELKSDPNRFRRSADDTGPLKKDSSTRVGHYNVSTGNKTPADSSADELLKRLALLKQSLSKPETSTTKDAIVIPPSLAGQAVDMGRLEHIVGNLQNASNTSDPQVDKLNGMLDKILRIQHPELVAGTANDSVPVRQPGYLPLSAKHEGSTVADLIPGTSHSDELAGTEITGFIDIDGPEENDSLGTNTLLAIVQEDQMLVAGATLGLRLMQDAVIDKAVIPKNTLLYGLVSLNGDRLGCTISSIRSGNNIYPTNLQVYDLDGLPGIHVPGAIGRDVAKQSADEGVNSVGTITSMDPTIGGQAATAGIQAARTFLSRKIKLVRVSVKSGYQVLLRNSKK